MNYTKILQHRIAWFLRENDCEYLSEIWQEDIKNFIINEYLEGEFAVEINNSADSLIWRIDRK